MLLITAELFVAAISAQRDRAVLPDQSTDEEGRDHRRIEYGLVVLPCKQMQDVGGGIAGIKLDVLGPKMLRDKPGKLSLIVPFIALKADGKRFDAR